MQAIARGRLAALVLAAILMCSAGAARASDRPDLRRIPASIVLASAALPQTVWLRLEPRPDQLQRLGQLPPPVRRLVLLQLIVEGWGRDNREGLHTFLFLHGSDSGQLLPEIAEALRESGLARHHAIFVQALALFGPSLPDSYRDRHRLFAWSRGNGPLNAFDRALMTLSDQFGSRSEFRAALEQVAERDPQATAWLDGARDAMSDEERLRWLVGQLQGSVDTWAPPRVMAGQLAALGEPYRAIFIASAFNREIMNGGMHQFFANSAGAMAPDLVAVLEDLKLPRHAEAVRQGIAMFPSPFERDTNRRRERHFRSGSRSAWDEALNRLAAPADNGAVTEALIALAKREGVLPR